MSLTAVQLAHFQKVMVANCNNHKNVHVIGASNLNPRNLF